jgi:hypothetical protein
MTHVCFWAPYDDTVVRERAEKKILAAKLFFWYHFNVHIPGCRVAVDQGVTEG